MSVEYYKYYTPIEKIEAIIPLLKLTGMKSLIDISAGCGGLITPLLNVLDNNIELTAIDIKWEALEKRRLENISITCLEQDALHWYIENEIFFDIVVSNPPFDATERIEFSDFLLTKLNLNENKKFFIEEIFTLINIDIINKNGTFVFILPATIMSNLSGKWIREKMLKELEISYILELNSNVFDDAKINTHIIIGKKKKPEKDSKINIGRITAFNSIEINKSIHQVFVKDRLDYCYLLRESEIVNRDSINLVDIVNENNISRGYLKYPKYDIYHDKKNKGDIPVWHTTNLRSGCLIKDSKQLYCNRKLKGFNERAVVRYGDILIARVGSNCVTNSIYVTKDDVGMASDCLYIIRLSNPISSFMLFLFLNTKYSKKMLKSLCRGLNKSSLTITDLYEFIVPDENTLLDVAGHFDIRIVNKRIIKKYLKYADLIFEKHYFKINTLGSDPLLSLKRLTDEQLSV